MKKEHEDYIGAMIVLLSALVLGSVVASAVYWDGLCEKTLFLIVVWLAATSIMWSIPFFKWFLPIVFKKRYMNKQVQMDERDLVIFKNAIFMAHTVCWFYFLRAWFVAWRMVGSNGLVSVNVIPLIFVGWVVLFQLVHVISCLIQGRMGGRNVV